VAYFNAEKCQTFKSCYKRFIYVHRIVTPLIKHKYLIQVIKLRQVKWAGLIAFMGR